jgi:hypothetical protein
VTVAGVRAPRGPTLLVRGVSHPIGDGALGRQRVATSRAEDEMNSRSLQTIHSCPESDAAAPVAAPGAARHGISIAALFRALRARLSLGALDALTALRASSQDPPPSL